MSSATFYAWKGKYGGMDVSDAKRLKALEDQLVIETVGRDGMPHPDDASDSSEEESEDDDDDALAILLGALPLALARGAGGPRAAKEAALATLQEACVAHRPPAGSRETSVALEALRTQLIRHPLKYCEVVIIQTAH